LSTAFGLQTVLALVAAALLLLLELGLAVALAAANALGPVALRRMASEEGFRHGFVESLQRATSAHRVAAILLQQLALLVAAALVVLAASWQGFSLPWLLGLGVGVGAGLLVLQTALARVLALWKPRQTLRAAAGLVHLAFLVLYPVVVPLRALLRRVDASQQQREGDEREEAQDEEVEALIEVGELSGLLEAEEGKMMRGIVDLDETLVREIMTPRTAIVALDSETTVARARRTLLEAGHSRLPVHSGSIDNVVGVLHSRDLFRAWEQQNESAPIRDFVRPAIFVPETLTAAELLAEMRQKTQIALVVDEYGGIAGLVTLEDVLEEIVGEIRDEHETEEAPVREEVPGRSWIVDAVAHVEELEALFGLDLGERDFDTVGGLVVSRFGRVPSVGERLETDGLELEVLDADDRRVRSVRVRRGGTGEHATGAP
jgi:CBS domain containing-hemolysin-like protein